MGRLVHDRSCNGPLPHDEGGCGGYVRCRACGHRFGWCRGHSDDLGFCENCFPSPEEGMAVKTPSFRFEPYEVAVKRDSRGKFHSKDVSP